VKSGSGGGEQVYALSGVRCRCLYIILYIQVNYYYYKLLDSPRGYTRTHASPITHTTSPTTTTPAQGQGKPHRETAAHATHTHTAHAPRQQHDTRRSRSPQAIHHRITAHSTCAYSKSTPSSPSTSPSPFTALPAPHHQLPRMPSACTSHVHTQGSGRHREEPDPCHGTQAGQRLPLR